MKLNKLCIAALVAGSFGMTSCSDDFLNEEQITQHDTEYFKTQEGIDALVTGDFQKRESFTRSNTSIAYSVALT